MVAGDYDMVFSETWGAPYDPHRSAEGLSRVLSSLEPPQNMKKNTTQTVAPSLCMFFALHTVTSRRGRPPMKLTTGMKCQPSRFSPSHPLLILLLLCCTSDALSLP